MDNVLIFDIFIFLSFGVIICFNKMLYGRVINDFFNPSFTFILFLFIFFFNLNTSLNNFGVLTGFLIFVGTISWAFGFYFNFYKYIKIHKWLPSYNLKELSIPWYLIIQFILVGASFAVTLIKLRSFGYNLQEYLVNVLLVEDENVKEGGNFWSLFYKLLKIPLMVNHFRLLENGKNIKLKLALITLIEVLSALSTVSSSRLGYIMAFVFAFFLYFRMTNKRPSLNVYTGVGLVLMFPVLNMLNRLRNGDTDWLSNFQISDLWHFGQSALKDDANPGMNFDLMVKYLSKTGDFHWGFFFISQFFFIIPRIFWADKPITSFEFAYTIKIMHEHPVQDGTTYTFTVFDVYAAFGIVSLVIMMIIFGVLTRYLYTLMYDKKVNCLLIIFSTSIILYYINFLRASFVDLSAYYILDFILVAFFYLVYRRLKIFQ